MRTLLIAASFLASTAHAYNLKVDRDGDVVRWTQPIHFVVDADLDQKLHAPGALEAVKAAVRTWSLATPGVELTAEAGDTKTAASTITVIDHDWPYDDGVFAVTIHKVDPANNRIIEADIIINAAQNNFRVLPATSTRGGNLADIQNTITHELGHALGLAHEQGRTDAVMFPMAYDGEVNKRDLSTDEVDGLDALYPLGATPAAGCSVTGAAPALLLALFVAARRARRAA